MSQSGTGEAVIHEKHNLTWLYVLIILALLAAGSYWGAKTYLPGLFMATPVEVLGGQEFGATEPVDDTVASTLTSAYQAIITAELEKPFVYSLVPEAGNRIDIVAPTDDTTADAADYRTQVTALSPNDMALAAQDTFDIVTMDSGQSYEDTIAASPYAARIYQIQDEVMHVAHELNGTYEREPLAKRVAGIKTLMTAMPDPFSPERTLTYPAGRAVNAFLAGAIMSKLDPVNSAVYDAQMEAMAKRGIAYGEYGQSDMAAARSVVTQYFDLLDFEIESGLDITW